MTQQPGTAKSIMPGAVVVTRDSETIGTVKEVRGAFFKVDAPHERDFWLTKGLVAEANAQQATLMVNNDKVGDFHRDEPHEGEPNDAIGLLKEMHDEARATFAQILSLPVTEPRDTMWKQLEPVLKVHEQMEDKYLYGPLADEQSAGSKLGDFEAEHDREVGHVDELISQLDSLNPIDTPWTSTLDEIRRKLSDHIDKEESNIFPKIRETWDEERLTKARADMLKLMHDRLPAHSMA
jgi:hypothetical protein